MSSEKPPAPEPTFERYGAVVRVASGPVTDLFTAEQSVLGRPVFIKALARGILPSSPFAAALEREGRLLTVLDHPAILRLVDFVREPESMWLVLEHVDGPNLEELLARHGRLSPAAACAVGLVIAEALTHAHERGIVHRDVQPRNVLVSRDGVVKLTNFAAAMDERLPTAPELLEGGSGFGTPAYMSPEQLLGEPEDPRSDLFSLGMVLYEMLAGKRPFDASSERASSHRVRHDPAPALGRVVPDVSPNLDRLVRRCLEKMPSDRWSSAAEVRRALTAELSELGFDSPRAAIRADLVRMGLSRAEQVRTSSEARRPIRARTKPSTIRAALAGQLVALLLLVVGGVAIQLGAARAENDRSQRAGAKLELAPARAGYLRVVAEPWAHVIVDGEPIDTTPFARSLPLAAGVHYVRLEHPDAPTERRTVTLVEGETVLLDVKLDVRVPRAPRPPPKPREMTDPTTP